MKFITKKEYDFLSVFRASIKACPSYIWFFFWKCYKNFSIYLPPDLNIRQKCINIVILNRPAHIVFVELSTNGIDDHMIVDN